jgi:hypothetical protein
MYVYENYHSYKPLNERRFSLKSDTDKDIYTNTSVRNSIILFVGSGPKSREDIKEFINNKVNKERNKPVHRSWIFKFDKYFIYDPKKGLYKLSKLGNELLKVIKAEQKLKDQS